MNKRRKLQKQEQATAEAEDGELSKQVEADRPQQLKDARVAAAAIKQDLGIAGQKHFHLSLLCTSTLKPQNRLFYSCVTSKCQIVCSSSCVLSFCKCARKKRNKIMSLVNIIAAATSHGL